MLNENAKKWVAALRSGKYTQGRLYLKTADGSFCCLGVACEVAIENGVEIEITGNGHADSYLYDGRQSNLPLTVRKWVGLQTANGDYENTVDDKCLIGLNDIEKKSFSEIADFIESEPQGLFQS